MDNQDITTLNSLIATTIDSANGFEESARRATATGLATQFAELARDRWEIVATLEAEVSRMGGTPKQSGTVKAAAHRRWLDVKNLVAGDDRTILQEVENGETYLHGKYEAALRDGGLSPSARSVVEDAFASVRRGTERARGLHLTVGSLRSSSQSNVDWQRIGKGIGIAAALGGAALVASRYARSRRTSTPTRSRRPVTISIDRTATAEIEARNREATGPDTSLATRASELNTDIGTAPSSKRSGGRRSGTATTSLAAGSARPTDVGGSTGDAAYQALSGDSDLGSDGGSSDSFGSTGRSDSFKG